MPSSSAPDPLLNHPTLHCTLHGKPFNTVTQFRNLKFGSIPARFQDSVPIDRLNAGADGTYDATRFGPSCPQKRGAREWDVSLLGNVVAKSDDDDDGEDAQGEAEWMDEFECLHAVVTVPNQVLSLRKKKNDGNNEDAKEKEKKELLPVFVWIHGGGLSMGSNNWPQYNLRRFVERSVAIGKPVIGVAINYRVGIFGFLASDEVGANGNMGFKDQELGLRWVKRHVEGFGGDPGNVTAAGESAGGISLSVLLCADVGHGEKKDDGLFERVVVMSGEATLRKPRGRQWHHEEYRKQIGLLGLAGLDVQASKKGLVEMSAEEVTAKLPLAQHFCGFVDGKWLKRDITLSALADGQRPEHKPAWCREFVVGDTAHDGTILKNRILDSPHVFANLITACFHHLTPSETRSLLSAYNLFPTPLPATANQNLLLLASELRFYLPTLSVSRGWKAASKTARSYHFHIPNPVDGPFKNLSSHESDIAFVLQNFTEYFGEREKKLAGEMADCFIRFANGEGWVNEGKVVIFGEKGAATVDEGAYDTLFRDGRGRVLEGLGYEKAWKLVEEWQGVRSEKDSANMRESKL